MKQTMKHGFSIALTTALVLLGACSREETESIAPPSEVKEYVSFRCGDPAVRTAVSEDGAVSWVAGDEITITYKGTTYSYTADNAGSSTTFSPKTDADRIPVSPDHLYTMDATYGEEALPLVQTVAADGTNLSKMPLIASVQELLAEDDEITLHFSHKASLMKITLAKEALAFKSLTLSGLNADGDITVNFPDGLDLSGGQAVVPVIVGAINTSADDGVLLDATCADDSHIARILWAGLEKRLATGTLINQELSTWKTSPAGISTGKELKEFAILTARGCPVTRFTADGTPGGTVKLLADVDISSFAPWNSIGPNGGLDPGESLIPEKVLSNEFDGGSHTISGLSIEKTHDSFCNYGLFGVAAANIHDLTVTGAITIGSGSAQKLNLCAGGLVSTLRPGFSVQRCTTNVAINIQYYGTETLSGSDVYNANSATVHKWQRVGGIAGRCSGTISECENKGNIKFTNGTSAKTIVVNCHYGGIAGQVCEYGSSDAGISDCTNSGNISSQGRIGGYSDKPSSSTDIATAYQVFQGMSLGGIVGTLGHMVTADMDAQTGIPSMSDCTNDGEIGRNYNGAGGNFGGVAGRTGCDAVINVTGCTNTKSVHGNKTSSESQQSSNNDFFNTMGGVIGVCHARGGEFSALSNSGKVYIDDSNTAAVIGGVFGIISSFCGGVTFNDLSNSGEVYTSKENADAYNNIGGIVGRLWMMNNAPVPVTLNNAVNTGSIHNKTGGKKARVGGLIGQTNGNCILNDCVNKGTITAWTANSSTNYCYVGGLIADMGDHTCVLNRCKQYGTISYNNTNSYHGLVFGCLEGPRTTASACYASGKFGVSGKTLYTISSEADYSEMVLAPSTDKSVTEGKIKLATFYNSSSTVGSPWEWSYHDAE